MVKWDNKKSAKKTDKLVKITLSTAEQSKYNSIPEVILFGKKVAFLAGLERFDGIFTAYEELVKEGEATVLVRELPQMKIGEKILFTSGLEDGISPEEIEIFESKGGLRIGLGPCIMRAEAAPLYALTSVSYALGLMK